MNFFIIAFEAQHFGAKQMRRFIAHPSQLDSSCSRSALHRKPTAWMASVFLVLGMGFGSAFAQSRVGTQEALPMKDFPSQCVSMCEPLARLYDAMDKRDRDRFNFYGCGNFPERFGAMHGTPMVNLKTRLSRNDWLKALTEAPQSRKDILTSNNPVGVNNYFAFGSELASCVIKEYILQSPTQESQQRPREAQARADAQASVDAQARADAQRQAQPQAAAVNPLQSQTQESQQRARDVQVRADADAQRKGKRSHDPAAEAHQCITNDTKSPGFGSLNNSCPYKVWYTFCNFRPKKDSWAEFHDCEKRFGLGADEVRANGRSATHVKNTEYTYWFACKDPSWPVDTAYVPGQGITGRCRDVGK